jgi:26S proteasome regulatory subunit N10
MKKEGISIDVIAFGELGEDIHKKLDAFNDIIKGGDGSHLEYISPSSNLLSDSIVATPILAGEGMGNRGAGGAGGEADVGGSNDHEFGIDPSVDPELALALRMSYEEEMARQEREKKAKEAAEGKTELETVPEGDESKPLIDKTGEPSDSKDEQSSKDSKRDDPDKMDTA